jgi:hypothetical protein
MDRRSFSLLAMSLALVAPLCAEAGEHGEKKELAPYLQLKSVTLTIVRPNRRHGAMTVDLGLNIVDAKLRGQAQLLQPVLRDAYVRALQPWAIRMTPGAPPDMGFMTVTRPGAGPPRRQGSARQHHGDVNPANVRSMIRASSRSNPVTPPTSCVVRTTSTRL